MSQISNSKPESGQDIKNYPPVVAVLGHVDHGKTTLLDAIRKTSLAQREVGGITQKIGASTVSIIHDGQPRSITFIDTPGHMAFAEMRRRGARVADVALLIVASTEGIKPQTKESIEVIRKTNTKFIIVLTKTDLPAKNTEKVKKELLKEQISLEEYGGDVPLIEVSAKTNHNIVELLDLILLVYDLNSSGEGIDEKAPLNAVVIESRLDPKAGPRVTIVIKNGILRLKDEIQVENISGKIKSIINDKGERVVHAGIGQAVEILGLDKIPSVGSIISPKLSAPKSDDLQQADQTLKRSLTYEKKSDQVNISVILVADTKGSLEALTNAFSPEIKIISQKTGEVSEGDIILAKTTESIVLSFNTNIRPEIKKLALSEKVLLREYTIIYEMLDEIQDALEGKLHAQIEQVFGTASVLAKFPYEKKFAYGVRIMDGRMARGDRIRILRGENTIAEASITSLRIGKNSTSKVEKGHEAGIVISGDLDIRVGDMILSHS